MSNYNINWSSDGETPSVPGKAEIILPQKQVDSTSTTIALTGKGLPNYGEIQQENFIRLMENFASQFPPDNPTIGQLWYNTLESILYLRVDPLLVTLEPKYFPQSPAAWVQVWPQTARFASLAEYNAMALTINRIIGAPSVFGLNLDAATNNYGWGQTDLVPQYTDINTLAPGFTTQGFPAAFDNGAWVILLSRLRKALRHVDVDVVGLENLVSPVGFIDDGRPIPPNGNTMANTFNDNPIATALPDYTAGFNNVGIMTLQMYYANTLTSISQLDSGRFDRAPISTVSNKLVGFNRINTWATTIQHNIDLTFTNEAAAKAYFNAGGTLQFKWSHSPSLIDSINTSWENFLLAQTNLIMDYRGLRHGTVYEPIVVGGTDSVGFYDLTGTLTSIYQRDRAYGAYAYISDGGMEIKAYTEVVLGTFVIHLQVIFTEGLAGGEVVQGTTVSELWGNKANGVNVNSPILLQPAAVGSGSFTL